MQPSYDDSYPSFPLATTRIACDASRSHVVRGVPFRVFVSCRSLINIALPRRALARFCPPPPPFSSSCSLAFPLSLRLKTFEGVPPPYDIMKKMVVPDAFRITRLKPGRRYCVLGRLSDEIGWKHKDAVSMLEDKRREAGKVYYETKKAAIAQKKASLSAASDKPFTQVLAQFGY